MKYFTMMVALVAATLAGNAADFTSGGLSYNVISDVTKTLSVVESSSATGDVVIPDIVTHLGVQYSVVEITKQAFADSKITSVSIPETIIKIGDGAFMGCNKLKSIVFNAVDCTIAGTQATPAFSGCTAVSSVSIGDDVTVIPPYIFQGLTSLRSISIPRKVSTIGDRAFADCTSVSEIYFDAEHCGTVSNPFAGCSNPFNMIISDNVEEVPANLCVDSNLKTLTVGENVKNIKYRAFATTKKLETVNYNAISAVTDGSIFYNSVLTKLVIGSEVKTIPAKFINYTTNTLASIVWNDKLEEIGESAFSETAFVSFVAPKTLKKIGSSAFPRTLTSVKLNEGLEELAGFDETKIKEVIIPSTVKVIGNNAFKNCVNLVKVVGLDSDVIESIGSYAFQGSAVVINGLKFGKNLRYIGNDAFSSVKGITDVKLNDGLETVAARAFAYTNAFGENFRIPESVRTIGRLAFAESNISGKLIIPEYISNISEGAFANNVSVSEIEYNAIDATYVMDYRNEGILTGIPVKSIKFGDQVQSICSNLCTSMNTLEKVSFPASVKHINSYVFAGCSKLSNVQFNEGLETIGYYAFQKCDNLIEVTIPSSVSNLNTPFRECSHLTRILYNAKECNGSFNGTSASNLQQLILGKDVEVIDLNDFPLVATLKWVRWNAPEIMKFNTSANRTCPTCPVVLGENVKKFIGFKFPVVISNAVVPPALTDPVAGATAYVPDVEAYEEDANWAKYVLRQSVTWSGTIDGQKLTYTTNFPYELTLKHYLDSEGNVMDGTPRELGDYKAIFTYTIDEDEFELISPLSIEANTSNTMIAADVRAHTGRRVVIPVEMVNDQPITSFQFDLYLPEGMTLALDEYGDYMVDLTSRKSNTHSVSTADIDGGRAVRIAAMSMRNQTFSGNEGTLVELTVEVAANAPVGEAVLSLRNIHMVEPSTAAQEFFTNRNDAKVSIGGFVEGDTNDDGQVTVADVVNTVNMVLGIEPEVFVFAAADLVADGKITISDVVAVMNIAMNAGNKAPALRNATVEEAAPFADAGSSVDGYSLSVDEVHLIAGETAEMNVAMDNVENVTAFQFDLTLPEGITVPEDEWGDPSIILSKRASRTHMLVTRYQPDGSLRVASYSSKNDPFRQNTGDLLTIELKATEGMTPGDYNIGFNFIELTNPDATPHYLPDFSVIASVCTSGKVCLRYDSVEMSVRGGTGEIIVSAPEAAPLLVCAATGIVVAQMQVEQGVTRIPAVPGFYIVNGTKLVVK